jgi:pilus assembly protein CpaB
MKGKSVALLLLALGCGLVASLGITQVLAKRNDAAPPADTVPVFVAKADIPMGALVTPETIKVVQLPKDRVPAGAVGRQEDLDGRRARQKIYADEVLIDPKLLAHGQVPTDSLVPKGLRVVPVAVTIETINGGLVVPGSRCDVQVYMRTDPTLGLGEPICKTVLQDIRVFAVNDVTTTESEDPKGQNTRSMPGGRTVSLLVTPAQAQMVTLAANLGSIKLILRSSEDSDQPKSEMIGGHELLGMAGGADRAKEDPIKADQERFMKWADEIRKALKDSAKADPDHPHDNEEHERFTMRIRTGGEVNDVQMVSNSTVQGMAGDEGVWTIAGLGPRIHGKATEAAANSTTPPGQAVLPARPTPPAGQTVPPAGALTPPAGSLTPPAGPLSPAASPLSSPAAAALLQNILTPPTSPGSPRSPGG